MYSLLVVDDDPWALQMLSEGINWRDCGFEKVWSAVNGKYAMQLIDNHQPDLIITDIKMDTMDGIELLTMVREKYPHIRVILLSGHTEFEYARAAIKKGAVDYLLKPVDENELILLAKRTLKEIKDEKTNREREEKITRQLEYSISLIQEKFIHELLHGNIPDVDLLKSELSGKNICMDFSGFYIIILEVDRTSNMETEKSNETIKDIKKLQKNMVESFFNRYGTSVCFYEGDKLVVGFSPEFSNGTKYIAELSEKIRKEINCTISMGVSRMKHSVTLVREAYVEANEALKRKFYLGTGQVIFTEKLDELSTSDIFDANSRQRLINYLYTGAYESANKLISELFDEIYNQKIAYGVLHFICIRLVSILNDSLEKTGYSRETLMQNGFVYSIDLNEFETIGDLKNYILGLYAKGVNIISGKGNKHSRKIIDDAIIFINEHLSEEISLDFVAQKLFVNPAYLSRLFKETVGTTFTHFLMKTRVDNAKELLKNSYLKVYEISEKVGYRNEKYFSRIFKDFEGITPSEYRDKVSSS